jgi:predicted DNA-binding transcriptional regulator YafY
LRMTNDHYKMALIAYNAPEEFVLHMTYIDSHGTVTERVASPIGLSDPEAMLVFCLGRQDIRALKYARILRMRLQLAADVLCPEAIKELVSHRKTRRRP